MRSSGTLFCILSAAGFGAMGIFGKLAYDEGSTVGTLLAVRFVLAALMFWALVLPRGGARELRELPAGDILLALGLGACGYALQAGGYFAALGRMDASVLALLLYTFPAIVTVAAIAIGRERADRRKIAALALASAGLVLVIANARPETIDPVGAAFGLGAACIYSAYILVSDGIAGRVGPLLLSALVCTGAAITLSVGGTVLGELQPGDVTPGGWGWLAALAVVSTFGAISLFFAGLRRVGPTSAAILSTAEPVVTVLLAYLVFAERLGPVQLVGGVFVVGAVLVLNAWRPWPRQPLRRIAAWATR